VLALFHDVHCVADLIEWVSFVIERTRIALEMIDFGWIAREDLKK